MVKIRLRRVGAKKQPHYRVVVADSRSPRDGKFIETIGHYNPRTEPPTIEIDTERALHWLSVGAQPTEAVRRMLDKLGIMSRAAAIQRGELPLELQPEARAKLDEEEAEIDLLAAVAEKAAFAELDADLAGPMAEEDLSAELASQLSLEDEEDEEEEFGELFDEDEELDEEDEDWESEDLEDEDDEDFEDDWELDVDEDDDSDDDDDDDNEDFEEDDE